MTVESDDPVFPSTEDVADWRVYRGTGRPFDDIGRLPEPPLWRRFAGTPALPSEPAVDETAARRAKGYQITDDAIEMVNAALYLRRPLLVTGKPGTGKSTLAYSIAFELMLGSLIYWPISSRSTLQDGLYRYDAIGRLQEANLLRAVGDSAPQLPDIGRYVTLGPLGTALAPRERPRVLLVDELDKSDIDLPNDLLNVVEEGRFEIPELARLPEDQQTVDVTTVDRGERVRLTGGEVQCSSFPIIVITSNAEREFPPAFLRRCVRLDIKPPDEMALGRIVESLLGAEALSRSDDLVRRFLDLRQRGDVATDQLLNAIYLVTAGIEPPEAARTRLRASLIRDLNAAGAT